MRQLNIQLDDWQQEVLSDLASARGVAPESLAKSLISERLIERMHTAFDDLLSGDPILGARELSSQNTIEQRLRQLFES